jgi:hypothetical protein
LYSRRTAQINLTEPWSAPQASKKSSTMRGKAITFQCRLVYPLFSSEWFEFRVTCAEWSRNSDPDCGDDQIGR